MDHSKNEMDKLLQVIYTSKVPGYQEFMHDVIVEDISNHDLNFETFNSFLFEWNKQVYDAVCEKAISYHDTMQLKRSSPMGIEQVRAMTSLLFHKNHVCLYS